MKHPFLVLICYFSLVIPNKTPLVTSHLTTYLGLSFQTPFEELNPETLSNQVMKYAKTVMQLEKGLPPNSVVPILKDKVEGMRHKVLDQQQISDIVLPSILQRSLSFRGQQQVKGMRGILCYSFP